MSDTAYNEGPAMMAARGQTYGKRKQQEEAQRAVPMRQAPTDVAVQQPTRRPAPMAPGAFMRPTERPQEPITAGAPFGAGAGPEAAGILPAVPADRDVLSTLQYLNQMYPNSDLQNLIDDLMMGG